MEIRHAVRLQRADCGEQLCSRRQGGGVTETGDPRVAAGYDLVYAAIPRSPTFQRIWREHALGDDFPAGFEHISFLTLGEMREMARELRLDAGALLADLACGAGGPGLWIAREAGARLTGIDLSPVAVGAAQARAAALGLDEIANFTQGVFAATGLGDAAADGVMTVDALQYAPDKRAAIEEFARILRPGGRLVFACFEMAPERVAGLPVLGTDPVADYRPLESSGFDITRYEETADWHARVTATYQALLDARAALAEEMGEQASAALLSEPAVTLQVEPYRRRVFVCATRR
jgi:ubiquinone/menaquinone biosynthesis C-methylase UbiE